jgi:hypothetical protein
MGDSHADSSSENLGHRHERAPGKGVYEITLQFVEIVRI